MLTRQQLAVLKKRSREVLRRNDMGNFTRPAPGLYPHQWNWDSAFVALGLVHFDPRRAGEELLSLLRGQWQDGMIPHIIFNPEAEDYYPGPEYWNSECSGKIISRYRTSGITQPPMIAIACEVVYQQLEDPESFLLNILPGLERYYLYFFNSRDPLQEGLTFIVHPWESGLDNSPRWDRTLNRINPTLKSNYQRIDTTLIPPEERPDDSDYLRYSYLIQLLREKKYRYEELYPGFPFLIQPVLFNTILFAGLEALKRMNQVMGRDNSRIRDLSRMLRSSINQKLYHPESGRYLDYDLTNQEYIEVETLAAYLPLFAALPDVQQAEAIINTLFEPGRFIPESGYPFCSVSMKEKSFSACKYWRGPVWINLNWMLIKGLLNYYYYDKAELIKERTLELVAERGFFEYFDPFTGKGLGANDFSWTAALVIDLIQMEF